MIDKTCKYWENCLTYAVEGRYACKSCRHAYYSKHKSIKDAEDQK